MLMFIIFSGTCKIPPVLWRDQLADRVCDGITGAADRPRHERLHGGRLLRPHLMGVHPVARPPADRSVSAALSLRAAMIPCGCVLNPIAD